jgi:hypothetical protein
VQACERNADCASNCCSLRFCSNEQLCQDGRKEFDDYCDTNAECLSQLCKNNKCVQQDQVVEGEIIIGIGIILAAIVCTVLILCCVCKGSSSPPDNASVRGGHSSRGRRYDNVDSSSLLNQSRDRIKRPTPQRKKSGDEGNLANVSVHSAGSGGP